jgi:hypothetical protein
MPMKVMDGIKALMLSTGLILLVCSTTRDPTTKKRFLFTRATV